MPRTLISRQPRPVDILLSRVPRSPLTATCVFFAMSVSLLHRRRGGWAWWSWLLIAFPDVTFPKPGVDRQAQRRKALRSYAIMAIFNFPIRQDDHPIQAVRAALEMQHRWRVRRAKLLENLHLPEDELCIGIGISSGNVSFREFGQSHCGLTAIGTIVNTAARAQSVARGGQILVTAGVRDRCESDMIFSEGVSFDVKGLPTPIKLFDAGLPFTPDRSL